MLNDINNLLADNQPAANALQTELDSLGEHLQARALSAEQQITVIAYALGVIVAVRSKDDEQLGDQFLDAIAIALQAADEHKQMHPEFMH